MKGPCEGTMCLPYERRVGVWGLNGFRLQEKKTSEAPFRV